jgi:uncharacterized membrane protein YgcG
MIRVISLVVAGFLFLSTLEAWAGFWLAGRWLISSRVASLTLGVVKRWLDRGIISRTTQMAKVFIQRNGKWILLTLGLVDVISEVQRRISVSSSCYVLFPGASFWLSSRSYGVLAYVGGSSEAIARYFSATTNCPLYTSYYGNGMIKVYEYASGRWWEVAYIPVWGTYYVRDSAGNVVCTFNVEQKVYSVCSNLSDPPSTDWQNERREVPVRVYPNPSDFVRPDVIESDPSLRYLRDEYQRISQDASIPTISQNDLSGVGLPSVGWAIPPEEALDSASEEGSTSSNSSSGSGSGSGSGSESGDNVNIPAVPGFDTSLNVPAKRSFPVELVNSIVQSHPLLRILQGVNLDVGGGGDCVIGSRPFEFNFCPFGWVLNLMGALIVFVGFITGLVWSGRSE